eukprot:2546542-Amphidinium_carterae.1
MLTATQLLLDKIGPATLALEEQTMTGVAEDFVWWCQILPQTSSLGFREALMRRAANVAPITLTHCASRAARSASKDWLTDMTTLPILRLRPCQCARARFKCIKLLSIRLPLFDICNGATEATQALKVNLGHTERTCTGAGEEGGQFGSNVTNFQ